MHQVFISYSSNDAEPAQAICAALERAGILCWIAPRDIASGSEWGAAIIAAIEASKAVVVVFSADSNASPQVVRELEAAVSARIPLVPVRIVDERPTDSVQYFLGVAHWLDAFPPPLAPHLPRIVEATRNVIKGSRTLLRLPRTRTGQIALGGAAVVAAAFLAAWLARPSFDPGKAFASPLAGRWQAELPLAAGGKRTCVLDVQETSQYVFNDDCPFPFAGARGHVNAQKGGIWASQMYRDGRDDGSYLLQGSAVHNVAGSYKRSFFGGGLVTRDQVLGEVSWSRSRSSDPIKPAAADVLPEKADWPMRDVVAAAQKSVAYVRPRWRSDAVLMELRLERLDLQAAASGNLPSTAGALNATFVLYSPSTQERLQLTPRGVAGALFPLGAGNVDARQALPARFVELADAIARARQTGAKAQSVRSAVLRWSSGPACGSFRETNAMVPPCRGPRYTGWQWEIQPATGDRIYVPASLPS
jgi:hypothetical protein